MSEQIIFLTHGDVEIDPEVPVPQWGLNAKGHARHAAFAADPAVAGVTSIFASDEQKAKDAAEPVCDTLGLPMTIRPAVGENDRSATGFLPPDEFWPTVKAFFAEPETSVQGWERACDAQAHIVGAVDDASKEAPDGDVLVVAHGGVGTLLRCQIAGMPITQDQGQSHPKGGCYFTFDRRTAGNLTDWIAI
ncbi:MAG: histidine phosphatase family protein [Pseudomonadota bacterium]